MEAPSEPLRQETVVVVLHVVVEHAAEPRLVVTV
jgi:hypothetical protein